MINIKIPQPTPTLPDSQIYSCGCALLGFKNYETAKTECKMHRELVLDYTNGLEGMY